MTEPQPKSRWLRFSLRTFFVLLTLLCIWLGLQVNAARRQREARAAIVKGGGTIGYEYQKVPKSSYPGGYDIDYSIGPPTPEWLRHLFGDDFFCNVISVGSYDRRIPAVFDWRLFSQLPKLEVVALTNVQMASENQTTQRRVNDSDLKALKSLSRLRSLYIMESDIDGSGFASLHNLDRVNIFLYKSSVDDAGLQEIAEIPTIKRFCTDSQLITDVGLKYLQRLKNLEILYLNGAPITNAGLQYLERLSNLKELSLNGTKVTDDGLEHLQRLTNLEILNFDGTGITDAGLQFLKQLTKLKELNLSRTKVTAEGIAELRKALPNAKIQ